jgi:hypothetical protein
MQKAEPDYDLFMEYIICVMPLPAFTSSDNQNEKTFKIEINFKRLR